MKVKMVTLAEKKMPTWKKARQIAYQTGQVKEPRTLEGHKLRERRGAKDK